MIVDQSVEKQMSVELWENDFETPFTIQLLFTILLLIFFFPSIQWWSDENVVSEHF